MRYLISIFICIYTLSVFANEIDSINLITPVPYSRTKGYSQDIKSSAEIWAGNLIGATDIGPKLKESFAPYRSDLATYFPAAGELDQLLNSITEEANRTIVKGKLTDEKAIEVNRFLGNKLIGKITDRILEYQGVTNPERRSIWINKILDPFNRCIDKSTNALFAADHCMTALTSSLIPSSGEAIVYELSRANLSSTLPANQQVEFNSKQVALYQSCMFNSKLISSVNVKKCSLETMKSGMLKISEASLNDTINSTASNKSNAISIKSKVWPEYSSCVQSVGTNEESHDYSKQFISCIDKLIETTGVQLVLDKISNTPSIKEAFTKSGIEKLAKEKAEKFKICISNLAADNVRKNGMLDSDSCKNQISNEVTYQVILKTLKENADKLFAKNPQATELSLQTGKTTLDKCWSKNLNDSEREKCTRSAIIAFSEQAAALKIDLAIPDEIQTKEKLKNNALENFKKCLNKNLPSNITGSNNTSIIISSCSDTITKDIALSVAEEEVRLSIKDSLPPSEIENTIKVTVDEQFSKCLGKDFTDKNIENCSDQLKTTVAEKLVSQNIDQYLADRPNIPLNQTRNELKLELMNNFKECLKNSDHKDKCTDELSKDANRKIVLAFSKIETSVQLNTQEIPSKLVNIQNQFTECTKTNLSGEELSKKLDECNKIFSLEFARNLGLIKLDFLLGNALGKTTLDEQKTQYESIKDNYNRCLNDLYRFKMADKLTEKISSCTGQLEAHALTLVRQNLNMWMASDEKDAMSAMVKNNFASILPCLSSLLPASPYSQSLQTNIDSALKPIAILLAQYIDYSPDNAKSNLNDVIAKLSENIKLNASSDKSKSDIIDLLYQNGALDQFIKAMVRGKVKDAFATLSEKDLPKQVRDQLITKENFDNIFSGPEGKSIKNFILENMLKPMLIKGADISSPAMSDNFAQVNGKVVKMLVGSPRFGDIIIKAGVQSQIDNMSGFSHFFAKMIYGSESLNWDNVRTTEAGKKAEEYIRQNILMPKFSSNVPTPDEEKRAAKEAENLVSEAVKKYTDSKK